MDYGRGNMREVDRLKNELAQAVKNSEEYAEYLHYKNMLNQKPELEKAVNEIRRLNYEFHNSDDLKNSIHEIDDMKQKLDYVHENHLANDYLKAELCLCRMIQDICNNIIEDIELDLDFLK